MDEKEIIALLKADPDSYPNLVKATTLVLDQTLASSEDEVALLVYHLAGGKNVAMQFDAMREPALKERQILQMAQIGKSLGAHAVTVAVEAWLTKIAGKSASESPDRETVIIVQTSTRAGLESGLMFKVVRDDRTSHRKITSPTRLMADETGYGGIMAVAAAAAVSDGAKAKADLILEVVNETLVGAKTTH